MCLKENKTTPAEDIHHTTSFMSTDDPVQRVFLAYDYDNLMSLCKKCHQAAHNKKGSST
jgi:5-methylcytosine-specific restriction protein A